MQHITEGQHVIFGKDHGNAFGINCFHDSRTGHFVATRTKTELGVEHEGVVVKVFGEVFVDANVSVVVLPVVEEAGADWTVQTAGEEGEVAAWGVVGWGREKFGGDFASVKVDFWKGDVLSRVEAL